VCQPRVRPVSKTILEDARPVTGEMLLPMAFNRWHCLARENGSRPPVSRLVRGWADGMIASPRSEEC